jgi:hypothetical protein
VVFVGATTSSTFDVYVANAPAAAALIDFNYTTQSITVPP